MTREATACIDENAIGALFDHRLSKVEVDEIDRHVARCVDCRDLLCGLVRMYSSPSSPSRALVQTAALVDPRATTAPIAAAVDEAHIRRLLALLGCERRVDTIVGGWRLDGVLGVGGMAEVYAATHVSNGQRAAIKLLRREWLSRPSVVSRFLREGYVANRLRHPGTVAVLGDGTTDNGTPFLVLELLDGQTIAPHVRERLPFSTVLWIASEILEVLGAAHARQIIHRDIKPDNVFLTRGGAVKVLDFGIARVRGLAEDGADFHRPTQHGTMMGTPAFMPPEQARGKLDEIDARTDLWALGATMFALLAGRPVRHGGTPDETLATAMKSEAPKLGSINPAVPPEICEIVDRALAFRRDDRWADAASMQTAIRSVLQRMDSSVPALASRASARANAIDSGMALRVEAQGGSAARTKGMIAIAAALALVGSVAVAARGRVGRAFETVASIPPSVAPFASVQTTSAILPVSTEQTSTPAASAPVDVAHPKAPSTRSSPSKPARRPPARRGTAVADPLLHRD